MTENNNRSGGTDIEAKEVNIGGDAVGRDKSSIDVKQDVHIHKDVDKAPGIGIMGVIGVVGLVLVMVLVLVLLLGPRSQYSGQIPNPQLAETYQVSATLAASTPSAMVTPTGESKVVSIEEIPFKVFAYGGDNDPNVGKGSGSLVIVRNGITGTEYYLDYFLPDEGEGYAGLAFRFLDSQDWTPYEFVEVTLSFEDPEASCDFGIRDIADKIDYVRLGSSNPTSDIELTISGKQQTAKIPLATSFKAVNRKVVHELICNADSYFVRGHHTLKVISIKLLKA